MKPIWPLCGMLLALFPDVAAAEEYLLRVEKLDADCRETPTGAVESTATTVRFVEIVVQPGGDFHSRTELPEYSVEIQGCLDESDGGELILEIAARFAAVRDSRPPNQTAASSSALAVQIGKTVVLGGSKTHGRTVRAPGTAPRETLACELILITLDRRTGEVAERARRKNEIARQRAALLRLQLREFPAGTR